MAHTLFFADLKSMIQLFLLLLSVDVMMIVIYQVDVIIGGDDDYDVPI